MTSISFSRCLDFGAIPSDWGLVRLSLDWQGHPLLLFSEGKPPQPDFHGNLDGWSRYQTPPKAHHLVYLESEKMRSVTFEQSRGLSIFHVQPFEDGWLLGEQRSGHTGIYDAKGSLRFTLDLGDASEDLQTTPDGQIWVSYFDEGVFGGGIGQQGLVCFDGMGKTVFKYADFAEQNALPMICDCYAMNIDQNGEAWINYYTDFPLVRLRNFTIEQVWEGFGSLGKHFAVRRNQVLYMKNEQLALRYLNSPPEQEPSLLVAKDENGDVLTYSDIAARGEVLLLHAGRLVFAAQN